ncbi:hypothetical protein H2199_002086 [Coniosporium tulheliwenetii]|uniref:Uncharacterized protein n=1 Tax=Coniosporium tulheliwenetii TaxID=3383036 RepID=A0ACC2ZHT6_9PEZI|nr:hypothetical protein H2199_002086 [Cladosporium sp. JES 115]
MTARAKTEDLPTIRKHLEPPSVKEEYDKLVKRLVPGTATWIFEQPAFVNWVDCMKPVLSLSGGPGCGKSYLSTSVIKHVLQNVTQYGPRKPAVGYFYFHDNDQRKRSVLNALCAMVYQIAENDEIYRMHAALTCRTSPTISMATIATVWADFIVSEFGAQSRAQLYLIFDGIDEAARDDIKEFIELLRDSLRAGLRAQVLLKLGDSFTEVIEISSKMNSEDITRFIDVKYDEYISIQNVRGLREKVISSLREKAKGMFLWCELMYQELSDIKQPKKLRLALEGMSSGLVELYERIFTRIETKANEKILAQIRELFCWVTYSKEPLSVLYLNQVIQFAIEDETFDVEGIIKNSCASLIGLDQTGRVLCDALIKSEALAEDSLNAGGGEDEVGELDEDLGSDSELDEDEAEAEAEESQRELLVNLRHASLGDYVKSKDLKATKATKALLSSRDAKVHIVTTSLRIICKGADVPEPLWLHATSHIWDQLGDLNDASEEETKIVVELIAEMFTSSPIQQYISGHHADSDGYPLHGDSFFFGSNAGLQNNNRKVIRKWLEKADALKSVHLEPKVSTWVKEVLANPAKLLSPLVKTCIREWLNCDGEAYELYWRFRFAWHCIVLTDLVPPNSNPAQDYYGCEGFPECTKGDPFGFLADLVEPDRTCDPAVLQQVEQYISLDKCNYEMYTCLGIARQEHLQDQQGAIAAFRTAISLNRNDNIVFSALVYSLWETKDYSGIMELFESYDDVTVGFWIRGQLGSPRFQEMLFYAAREADKTELLIGCYERELSKTWDRNLNAIGKIQRDLRWGLVGESRRWANERRFYTAGSSFLRCWLALLYAKYRGQPDVALNLWRTAIFRDSEVFKLCPVDSSFSTRIVPDIFAQYAGVLYNKALQSDGSVDGNMLTPLERLRQRYDAFQELDTILPTISNQKKIYILLAQLYIRCGRTEEARALLNEQFQRSIEILKDEIDWNDTAGYNILSKILFASGRSNAARIALSLRRFDSIGYSGAEQDSDVEESDPGEATEDKGGHVIIVLRCANRWDCASGSDVIWRRQPMYSCMTCVEVDFCERCYSSHVSNEKAEGAKRLYVCNSTHQFLKAPLEDWTVKDGIMTISGRLVKVAQWLDDVEKKWDSGHGLCA